jgi:hypothetical protein
MQVIGSIIDMQTALPIRTISIMALTISFGSMATLVPETAGAATSIVGTNPSIQVSGRVLAPHSTTICPQVSPNELASLVTDAGNMNLAGNWISQTMWNQLDSNFIPSLVSRIAFDYFSRSHCVLFDSDPLLVYRAMRASILGSIAPGITHSQLLQLENPRSGYFNTQLGLGDAQMENQVAIENESQMGLLSYPHATLQRDFGFATIGLVQMAACKSKVAACSAAWSLLSRQNYVYMQRFDAKLKSNSCAINSQLTLAECQFLPQLLASEEQSYPSAAGFGGFSSFYSSWLSVEGLVAG